MDSNTTTVWKNSCVDMIVTLPHYVEYLCRYDNNTTAAWKNTCIGMPKRNLEEAGNL
jgi:hypothetical protein